jgi:integrase
MQRHATFAEAKAAKATGKPIALRFGEGLFLWVTPNGTKSWRCKYQPRGGAETTVVLGRFPEMSIVDAQVARAAIREQVRQGSNPKSIRREVVTSRLAGEANTLRAIAELWAERARIRTEWTDDHDAAMRSRLARFVYPKLGDLPVADVTMENVEALIFALYRRAPATATCVKQYLGGIFDYALRHRMVPFNPVTQVAVDLPTHSAERREHRAHVRSMDQARAVLAAMEADASGRRAPSPYTLLCHRFIALTAVRKLEAIGAQWREIDRERGIWTIPAERMKGKAGKRRAHIVALSPQALDVLAAARALTRNEFIFPSMYAGKRQAARSVLNVMMASSLARAGLGPIHTVHGWRHTFATLMVEANFRDKPVVDAMLAHKPVGVSHAAMVYDHAELIEERRRVACAWADMLMQGAPAARALIGLEAEAVQEAVTPSNVVRLPQRGAQPPRGRVAV